MKLSVIDSILITQNLKNNNQISMPNEHSCPCDRIFYLQRKKKEISVMKTMNTCRDIQAECGDKDHFLIYQMYQNSQLEPLLFRNYDFLKRNNVSVNSSMYEMVYVAELTPLTTLAKIYQELNADIPDNFHGHALSIGDVVVLYRNGNCTPYFVDSRNFVELTDFFPDLDRLTGSTKEPEITVLVVEPGKVPYFKRIANTTESLEKEVDGMFQAMYPFEEMVAILYDEEAQFKGKPLNRALRDEEGGVYDVLKGTFLITGIKGSFFSSISAEDGKTFFQKFQHPQIFVPESRNTTECRAEWNDDSGRGCSDCPDDECTGHCTSCFYRPV